MADPWDLAAEYSRQRSNERIARGELGGKYDIANMNIVAREQAASTLFGRQLQRDELTYGRQLERDAASRQFSHEENYLQNVTYKRMGRRGGRRDYVGGGRGNPQQGGGELMSPQGAMDYYVNARGVPPHVAAAIVGNIDVESGWDPAVWSGARRGDNGSAAYAGQWRGPRQAALINFARQNGHEQPTAQDQLDFFLAEGSMGHDRGAQIAQNAALSAQSPEEAAHAWMTHYERPSADPGVNRVDRRMAVARQVYEQYAGAGGQATPQQIATGTPWGGGSTQRRYGAGGGIPSAAELYAQEQADQDAVGTVDVNQPMRPWTDIDASNEGLTAGEWAAVQARDMDIVGTNFFSGAQIATLTPREKDRLMALGGYDPEGTNEYLILQPKPTSPQYDPNGMPTSGAGTGPAPIPLSGQTQSTQGTQAPAVTTSAIPVKGRNRRNPDTGELEFLIDGEWHTSE
jgi:hypothetical protein